MEADSFHVRMVDIGQIPHFDLNRPCAAADLCSAASRTGLFYVSHPLFLDSRCEQALNDARAFFDLPAETKRRLAIERSPHFRGYSEMMNERDWREQIHFGREGRASAGGPAYGRLRGPNLWPVDAAWRDRLVALMADLERVGREILSAIAGIETGDDPYLLLKLIHYRVPPGGIPRSGVAPHVDFSWITLLLQDDAGGLEARTPEGAWIHVPPVPGTLVVNIGEILQFTSGGRYRATPHRVVSSASRSRISLPFFLNPGLDTRVSGGPVGELDDDGDHVHRVLSGAEEEPFVFGEAEWKRKGLGVWCRECVK